MPGAYASARLRETDFLRAQSTKTRNPAVTGGAVASHQAKISGNSLLRIPALAALAALLSALSRLLATLLAALPWILRLLAGLLTALLLTTLIRVVLLFWILIMLTH
jgi:hypothetical protein